MTGGRFVSYAQHGEDVILWRALGPRTDVFYVDVGAFHPTYDSVTKALYERGWRGINIEPQQDRIGAFERDRPDELNLAVAVGDHDGSALLTVPGNPGWASLVADGLGADADADADTVVEVPLRRISTVLAENGIEHVDVLKVDVEGGEPAVVRGMLDGPVRPVICVIEGVAPGIGRAAGHEAVDLLTAAGYIHCLFDGLNHYLTADADLVDALSVPASPVDEYVTDLVERLTRERMDQATAIARLVTENATLRGVPGDRPSTQPTPRHADRGPADDATVRDTPGASSSDTVAAAVPPPTATPVADPETRRTRRRQTFLRILRGGGVLPIPRAATPSSVLGPDLDHLPIPEAVAVLYRRILGRAPDEQGLALWSTRVDDGTPLLTVARELALSDESRLRSEAHQARAAGELAAWGSRVALNEIGAGEPGAILYTPGRAAEEIFVRALYEVAFRRRPSGDEVAIQFALLADGMSREAMLRGFALHADARAHLLGHAPRTPRGALRGLRDRRTHMATFRTLVAAAESRRIGRLLEDVASCGALTTTDAGRNEED